MSLTLVLLSVHRVQHRDVTDSVLEQIRTKTALRVRHDISFSVDKRLDLAALPSLLTILPMRKLFSEHNV